MDSDQENLLDELLAQDSGLTGSEIDFLESLDAQRGRALSDGQLDWLNDIADRLGLGGLA